MTNMLKILSYRKLISSTPVSHQPVSATYASIDLYIEDGDKSKNEWFNSDMDSVVSIAYVIMTYRGLMRDKTEIVSPEKIMEIYLESRRLLNESLPAMIPQIKNQRVAATLLVSHARQPNLSELTLDALANYLQNIGKSYITN